MLEWLLASLDPSRPHTIDGWIAWHGRLNYLGWVILAPLAIIIARFFKVLPKQNWPQELDNQLWWHFHWIGQSCAVVLSAVAIMLLYIGSYVHVAGTELHQSLGYIVAALVLIQIALGIFRGSKGGPTDPLCNESLAGDHYDMSKRRCLFEQLHKVLGYATVLLAAFAVVQGMWAVNAPRWMWLLTLIWWILLIVCFIRLQRQGKAIDTYQAIWGPGAEHPGNQMPAQGLAMRRFPVISEHSEGDD